MIGGKKIHPSVFVKNNKDGERGALVVEQAKASIKLL